MILNHSRLTILAILRNSLRITPYVIIYQPIIDIDFLMMKLYICMYMWVHRWTRPREMTWAQIILWYLLFLLFKNSSGELTAWKFQISRKCSCFSKYDYLWASWILFECQVFRDTSKCNQLKFEYVRYFCMSPVLERYTLPISGFSR